VLGPSTSGTSCRFLLSTLSWFDLVSRSTQPRPDLARLVECLNALEGTAEKDEVAWRAQDRASPSPELWFGRAGHERFAEHATEALAPSALDPQRMKALILDELRASWVFPETNPETVAP
jgi:hypothetical protein